MPAAVQAVTGPGARVCGAVISDAALGQPAVTDNCSATLTRAGVPEGNLFPVGATTITWTATDPSGNATVVTQTVAVVDDTPPTLAVPPALTLATGPDATGCGLAVTDAALDVAAAEDNCSVVLIRTGVPDGHFFPIGTTTITYTATDPSGNTVSATQLVTVTDATPPRITVADLTRPTDAGLLRRRDHRSGSQRGGPLRHGVVHGRPRRRPSARRPVPERGDGDRLDRDR